MLTLVKGRILFVFCGLLAAAQIAYGQTSVKLNEVLANNVSYVAVDGSITDWIELVNTSASPVDLSGAMLSDDQLAPDKFLFPEGSTILPNSFLVIACDGERPASSAAEQYMNTGFGIKASGGGVYLYSPIGALWDFIKFGVQAGDFSIGRVGGIWKLCVPTAGGVNLAATLGSPSALKVNEWLANSAQPEWKDDWFEIYNGGEAPIALDGLYLTDDLTKKTKSPVPALSFIGVGLQGYTQFIADNNTNNNPDHVAFGLSNGGESIGIFDGLGNQIDAVSFGPQLLNTSEGRLPDGNAFITSFPGTASPARANYRELPSIVVSELLSHTDPPLEDAVEFYNKSDADINIGGWYLSNKESELKRYRIPTGTVIPAKGYKVIYESAFNQNNPLVPFTFNSAHGDQVYLAQTDASGNLTGYRAGEEFEAAENGVSFGRVETSIPGDHKFVAMTQRTFGVDNPESVSDFERGVGGPNSAPRVGPIVINEVMFNPVSEDGVTDNRFEEFIELHNITGSPVLLYDPLNPENRWRLQNGVSYVFPTGKSIPAGGFALVVSFDPGNLIDAGNFRFIYNIPDSVQLYGPFIGDLNNDGDSLELNKPDPPQIPPHPDAGFVPYIRVDKVNYTDRAPWPTSADGTGFSLQRKNRAAFGNEPLNWDGAAPTPGKANSADLADTDGDGMTDIWEEQYGFDKTNPADASLDFDADGFTNVQEYIAGTDPKSAASRLQVSGFTAPNGASGFKITFTAAADKSYSVMYRNSLAANSSWQKLKNVVAEPSEHVVTVEDTDTTPRTDRYYQIVTPAAD